MFTGPQEYSKLLLVVIHVMHVNQSFVYLHQMDSQDSLLWQTCDVHQPSVKRQFPLFPVGGGVCSLYFSSLKQIVRCDALPTGSTKSTCHCKENMLDLFDMFTLSCLCYQKY